MNLKKKEKKKPYKGEVQFQLRWLIDPVFTYVWWAGYYSSTALLYDQDHPSETPVTPAHNSRSPVILNLI